MVSLLFTDCVDRFLAWTAANRKPKTTDHYRYQLGRFAAAFGPRRSIEELSPAAVSTFSSKFHPVQAVQRLCNWLYREERSLTVNPLLGMRKPKMGMRRRVLDRGQVVQLLRGADACFRRVLMFASESMARPQEVRGLKWCDLAETTTASVGSSEAVVVSAYFVVAQAKGYDRRSTDDGERTIPISPRLSRLLGRLARAGVTLDGPILRDSRGRAWTANAVRCRMRRLRERVGLLADRRGERVVAYTLRHTGATAAAAAGCEGFLLAGLLGHASPRTTERYVHLRPADLVDAAERVWEAKSARKRKNDVHSRRRTRPD